MRSIIREMKMKMKNTSHRYDINRSRPYMYYATPKQHLKLNL